MKIQGSSGRSTAAGAISGASPTNKAGQPSAVASAGSAETDQIQLSNLAQFAAASDESSSHVAKLSSLSATVSSGRYQVEAGVLSNSIIDANTHISGGNYA
jgi:anti-sigma28 factor (negative regulator of flagellin synthesis)